MTKLSKIIQETLTAYSLPVGVNVSYVEQISKYKFLNEFIIQFTGDDEGINVLESALSTALLNKALCWHNNELCGIKFSLTSRASARQLASDLGSFLKEKAYINV